MGTVGAFSNVTNRQMITTIIMFYIPTIVVIFGIGVIRMFLLREDIDIAIILTVWLLSIIPFVNFIIAMVMGWSFAKALKNYYWSRKIGRFIKLDTGGE